MVAAACWWLSPLTARTAVRASPEYVRSTAIGAEVYDLFAYSQMHRRPFERCTGAAATHARVLDEVAADLPAIEAGSRFEVIRLARAVRRYNQATQTFYASPCSSEWQQYFYDAYYQSAFLKVAPVIWVLDVPHRSEIYVVVALIAGSWVGVFALFWIVRHLTGSALAGFASLGLLWAALTQLPLPGQYVDFRLNLLNTFALAAAGVFMCDRPDAGTWARRLTIDLAAGLTFAVFALLLLFTRLSPSRMDATVVLVCVLAVAVIRRSPGILRRVVLAGVLMTVVQWPYNAYAKTLLAPVSAVNTANADEYKMLNAVNFLTERPGHFGNFILDYNFAWAGDGDYYLRQLSPIQNFFHGYPEWGSRYMWETAVHHPTEFPSAWWRRFLVQFVYHDQMSFGIYGGHPRAGAAVVWIMIPLALFVVISGGRALAASWPVLGLLWWELFGLHTLLGMMHTHPLYLQKGVALLWCLAPLVAVLAARRAMAIGTTYREWRRPPWLRGRAAAAAGLAVALAAGVAARGYLKEVHAMRVWRAVHVGTFVKDAARPPDDILREVESIRALGGDAAGTVTMYGAWAMFGYLERFENYRKLGVQVSRDYVRQRELEYYRRGLAEGPGNPHFYEYANYFQVPDWPEVFKRALARWPEHSYAAMMTFQLANSPTHVSTGEQRHYFEAYDAAVRRQLRDGIRFRKGFQETPAIQASGHPERTTDGQLITLLPGETAKVGVFQTFGTDSLAIGLFLDVKAGDVTATLDGQPTAKTVDAAGPLAPSTNYRYRSWHFTGLHGDPATARSATSALVFTAGTKGARFLVRDLYPLVQNPRWFR